MTIENTNPAPTFFADGSAVIGAGGTETQVRSMADALVQYGAMTRDSADAALKAGGIESAPADSRTDGQKQFDRSFPTAQPGDYRLDFIGRIPPETETTTIAEFNTIATTWLSELGLPPAIGPSIIERSMEVGQRNARLSPAARELWRLEQAVNFDRIAKTPERAAALRAAAEQALSRGSKAFTDGLRTSGALHDATVLMNLALHGERLSVRRQL